MNAAPRLTFKTFDLSERQFYLAEVIAGDDEELTSLCAVNMDLLHAVVQIARRPNPGRLEAIKDAICEHCAKELAELEANDNGGPDPYTHAVSLQSVSELIDAAQAFRSEVLSTAAFFKDQTIGTGCARETERVLLKAINQCRKEKRA